MPRTFNVSVTSRRRLLALPEVYEEAGTAFFIHRPTGVILRTSKEIEAVLPWFFVGSGKRVRTIELETLRGMWMPLYQSLMERGANVIFVPVEESLMSVVKVICVRVCTTCGRNAITKAEMKDHGTCKQPVLESCAGFTLCKDKESEMSRFIAFIPNRTTDSWFQKNWRDLDDFLSIPQMKKIPKKSISFGSDTENRNQEISDKSRSAMQKAHSQKLQTKTLILKSKGLLTRGVSLQKSSKAIPKSPKSSRKPSYEEVDSSPPEKSTRASSLSSSSKRISPPERLSPQELQPEPDYQEHLDRNGWIVKIAVGSSIRLDQLENCASRVSYLNGGFDDTCTKMFGSTEWPYITHITLCSMKESINEMCKELGGYECRLGMSWIEVIEKRKKLSFKIELSLITDEYDMGWYAKVVVDSFKSSSTDSNASQEEHHTASFESRQLNFSDLCQFIATQSAFLTSLIRCCGEYGGRLTKDTVIEASWNATRLPVDADMALKLARFGVAKHLGYL